MKEKRDEILHKIGEKVLKDSVVRLMWQKTDEESGKLSLSVYASGFFVSKNLIVTNIHCVAEAPSIVAELVGTETEFSIEGVVTFDAANDLVILKVSGEGVPLTLDDNDTVQIGDGVCTVGYPAGKKGVTIPVTILGIRNSDKRIQIKEALEYGLSGGAMLNNKGVVIGIAVTTSMYISAVSTESLLSYSHAIHVRTLAILLGSAGEVELLAEWQKRPRILAYVEVSKGQIIAMQGKYAEAIKHFDAAQKLYPDLVDLYAIRACIRIVMGEAENAITDCDAALELKPDLVEAYLNRAAANLALQDFKGSIDDCDTAIKLNPDIFQSYICKATANFALGQHKAALDDYDVALKINPDSVEAYLCRAHVKWELKDYAGAIEDFDKIINLSPESEIAYINRGYLKSYIGDYEEAINDYDKVIQFKPTDDNTYFNRGDAKYRLGNSKADHGDDAAAEKYFQDAIEDYSESIKLNPEHTYAYNNRGWTWYLLGQLKTKQKDIEKATNLFQAAIADSNESIHLKQDNPTPSNYHTRAVTKAALHDYDGAIEDFDEAIQIKPDNALYYHERGLVKETHGQHEEAKADFEKAKELDPDVENKSY